MAKHVAGELDQHQKEFVRLLQLNSQRHRPHTIFADFCEMSALAISNSVDRRQFEAREARYLEIVKRYERDEVQRFPAMHACIVNSLELGMNDCLGQLFMSLELGNHWKGQYFTPYSVASLMAQLILPADQAAIDAAGGFVTLNEPAVGAGGMVIAAAEAMRLNGINYQRHLHVVAQDVDTTAVHMAYIQLSLLYIPAIVILGNTLMLEEREHWLTPAHVLGGWDAKLARRAAEQRAAEPAQQPQATVQDQPVTAGPAVAVPPMHNTDQLALF